jgi:Domain of unknown function (DUF4419)
MFRDRVKHYNPEELVPEGITKSTHHGRSLRSMGGIESGAPHTSTFDVVPSHSKLAAGNGVSFKVETVPDPLAQHLNKPSKTREQVICGLQSDVVAFYNQERRELGSDSERLQAPAMRLEALSDTSGKKIVHTGGNGLAMALFTAFAQHLPLVLSPDDIWMPISYAFAKHVDLNAEALRKNFVQHEGKMRLEVMTGAGFRISTAGPDTGASAAEWESQVFPQFSSQIKNHIGTKTHEAIASSFSTTTAASKAAHEITLMSAMKNYFSYGLITQCGIPSITLLGTLEDWEALRARAEHLGTLMLPEFSDYWMPLLLPVLDEFVQSYKGVVNHGFWQSMVKFRRTGGSGGHSFISGWMQLLFPYIGGGKGHLSSRLRPWHEMYFTGPELDELPLLMSSAPVDWNYHGAVYDLNFHAGVLGFTQDESTGALAPLLGWYVSHVPPRPAQMQLKVYKKELNDILLGHKEEAASANVDKDAPWYRRVQFLKEKVLELEQQVVKDL